MGLLGLVLIGLLIYLLAQIGRRKQIADRRAKLLAWAQPYVKDQCFISVDASSLIGFDFAAREVFLACSAASGKYKFDEIASCELLRDDISLTQTNRGAQALGVGVGAILLGPAGALVGSLTGSKRSTSRLARLELKVVVDCRRNPVYRILLFESEQKKGAKLNDPRLRQHLIVADQFHGHLINAMRNSELARVSQVALAAQGPTTTISTSTLRELFELKQIGAISEQEYETAKLKALALPGQVPRP